MPIPKFIYCIRIVKTKDKSENNNQGYPNTAYYGLLKYSKYYIRVCIFMDVIHGVRVWSPIEIGLFMRPNHHSEKLSKEV